MADMRRTLSSRITATVTQPAEIVLNIAAAGSTEIESERLDITLDGDPIDPSELTDSFGGRWHLLEDVPAGSLEVTYRAEAAAGGAADPLSPMDRVRWLRPSRYVDTDRIEATAAALFAGATDTARAMAVQEWVWRELSYIVGSSRVTDGASDTYLARAGVCRDYTHLTTAFLRAGGVPARLVSVYAPGLSPMDFHAVVEAHIEGAWHVLDPTRLAPRQSLVRIGTGADAADTSFFTVHRGGVDFGTLEVSAVVDGDLPRDDHTGLIRL